MTSCASSAALFHYANLPVLGAVIVLFAFSGNFISSAQRSLAKSDLTALQLQDMKSSDQTLGIKAAAALIKRGNGECGIPSPDAAAFNELVTPRVHHSKEPLSETEFGEGDSEPDNTEPLATSLTASTPPEKSSPEAQKAEELKPESSGNFTEWKIAVF